MQKHVHLVDLVKSFPTNIFLQNLASIQQRTSVIKFAHLDEKSEEGSISNLSTKVTFVTMHHKGSYFAAVAPHANPTRQCTIHNLSTKKSLTPFKVKGSIQTVAFHPSKPIFFVASMRTVRVYDLQKQACLKQLVSGVKHISSAGLCDHILLSKCIIRVLTIL